MAEPAHTPGPWDYQEVKTSCGRAFRIGAGEMLTSGVGGCIIYDDYPAFPRSNEREANARLIAAAPELLKALKALFRSYKELADSGDAGFWALEDTPDGKQALAALAKATGGE